MNLLKLIIECAKFESRWSVFRVSVTAKLRERDDGSKSWQTLVLTHFRVWWSAAPRAPRPTPSWYAPTNLSLYFSKERSHIGFTQSSEFLRQPNQPMLIFADQKPPTVQFVLVTTPRNIQLDSGFARPYLSELLGNLSFQDCVLPRWLL